MMVPFAFIHTCIESRSIQLAELVGFMCCSFAVNDQVSNAE